MKRLLIASAALALIGAGSAFAQQTQPAPDTSSAPPATATPPTPTPDSTMPAPSSAMPDPSTTTASPAPSPATDATPAAPSAAAAPAAPATPLASSTTPTVVGDLAQANPPPADGSYPVCKTHKQDRCVVASQMKHSTVAKQKTASKTPTGA